MLVIYDTVGSFIQALSMQMKLVVCNVVIGLTREVRGSKSVF